MKKRGVGFACMLHANAANYTTNSDGTCAVVRVHDDGFVTVHTGVSELGQGILAVMAQIVAEELGILAEDVKVDNQSGGSDCLPDDLGAWSSRSTVSAGPAIQAAARDAKMQIWEIAAKMLGVEIDQLEGKERRIYVKGDPEKSIGFHEAVWNRMNNKSYDGKTFFIMGSASYFPEGADLPSETGYGSGAVAMSVACHSAEIEVDTETGEVKVLNYYAVHDAGRLINPQAAKNQVMGGVLQSLGWVLGENLIWKNGKVLNSNLIDYKMLTQADIPDITSMFVETFSGPGPWGAKGLGETPNVPVGAAISNAIYNTVGVRLCEMPFTRDKILKAIKEKEALQGKHPEFNEMKA